MTAARAFECVGEVVVGQVSSDSRDRLREFAGEWLEFSGREGRIVVRHVQPGGAPALSAVPAELIAILDALSSEERAGIAGGTLLVRDRDGILLRLTVVAGEIRVEWPREDWERAEPVPLERVFEAVEPESARVSGEVRLLAPAGAEAGLIDAVEGFEGLYPESDLRVERDGGALRAEFRDVNIGPEALLTTLRQLARPPESLAGELDVGSFTPNALERDFRLRFERGAVEALRPRLWREE